MRWRNKSLRRKIVIGVLLLIVAGFIAPFLRAGPLGERIRIALENAIGREVEVGSVRFNLFRGPGFSLLDVVIHDDPAVGIEPLAYVDSLDARIRLTSLLRGRLEFASLRLVEPTVNLVKPNGGPWNLVLLLDRSMETSRVTEREFPEIQVRAGRVNFKFGDVKSVFYFTAADIEIRPISRQAEVFEFQFSGEPSRADRAAQGFGRLSGSGRWRSLTEAEGRLAMDVQLERSDLGEIIALLHGHDVGLHGFVSSQARLDGPVSSIQISGKLQTEEIHDWNMLPPYGPGGVRNYHGNLDLLSQRLELETVQPPEQTVPFDIRFEASDYLTALRWMVTATLKKQPLSPVVALLRQAGLSLPKQLSVDGTLDGVLRHSSESGTEGAIVLLDATIKAEDSPPVRLDKAQIKVSGDGVLLSPTVVLTEKGETASLGADFRWLDSRLDVTIRTDSMEVDSLRSSYGLLLGEASVPLLEDCREGRWEGRLSYAQSDGSPGSWSGSLRLNDARISVPGVADPVEVTSARVVLSGRRILMSGIQAQLGEVAIGGEYRFEPLRERPHRFRLLVPKLEIAEMERLLMPTLNRPRGLLARALRLGRVPVPVWLRDRHVDGTLEIGSLSLGDISLEDVRAHLFWDAARAEVAGFTASLEGGLATGYLSADLSGATPQYRMGVRVDSANWRGGRVGGDGTFESSGVGANLFANLRSEGVFSGESVLYAPEAAFQSVSGAYEFSWSRSLPQLRFFDLRVRMGKEILIGQGAVSGDGQVQLDLANEERQLAMAGTLPELEFDVVNTR